MDASYGLFGLSLTRGRLLATDWQLKGWQSRVLLRGEALGAIVVSAF